MDADSLSQRHCDSKESILCEGLRLRKEREAHLHRQREGAAKLRTQQAVWDVGIDDQGSSRRLHQLGRIRAQSEADRPQQLRPRWRRQDRYIAATSRTL